MAKARRIPVSFGFQSRPGKLGPDGTNRIINAYSEEAGEEGKQKLIQYAIEGLRPVTTLSDGPVRAGLTAGNFLFVLAGRTLFRVDKNWNWAAIGTVNVAGPTFMARNRREVDPEIVVTTGGDAWLLKTSPDFNPLTFEKINDPDLPRVSATTFLDGFFIYSIDDLTSGRFMLSGVDDGGTINPVDFATAESDPDRLRRPFRRKGELWLMGEKTIEVWSNNADPSFPFIRLPGVAIDRGCLSGPSVALLEEMVIWVADDKTVRAAESYRGQRISHHAVERAIEAEPNKESISALTITYEGHSLYCLSGSTFTWVYDHTTSAATGRPTWHERKSFRKQRWRGEVAVTFNNHTVVGDFETGDLYVVDPEHGFEGADPIVMLMRGPIQHDFPNAVQFFDLALDIVPGVGKLAGSTDDVDPHAMCRYSDDGGMTWSNQRRGSIGKRGESRKRIKFGRLGQSSSQGRVMEFSISAGVARAFLGANAKVRRIAQR